MKDRNYSPFSAYLADGRIRHFVNEDVLYDVRQVDIIDNFGRKKDAIDFRARLNQKGVH